MENERLTSSTATLKTIDADSPRQIRRVGLEALLSAVDADWAVFARYRPLDGVDHYTDTVSAGGSQGEKVARQFDNVPSISTAYWDPRTVRAKDRRRFVAYRSEVGPVEDLRGTMVFRSLYARHGIHDQLRILAYDGPYFLGWLALMRHRPTNFTTEDTRRLDQLAGPLCDRLAVADQTQEATLDQTTALLLSADGQKIAYATRTARRWLTPRRADGVKRFLRLWKQGRRERALVGGALLSISRLDGPNGVRYLVRIRPTEAPRVSPAAPLTPRQTEISEFAAAGATADEIARHLDISPNTVKSHLKAAYRRLEVNSRVELRELLGA
jgi:DNA-binding CsgD family transcriptional regulator